MNSKDARNQSSTFALCFLSHCARCFNVAGTVLLVGTKQATLTAPSVSHIPQLTWLIPRQSETSSLWNDTGSCQGNTFSTLLTVTRTIKEKGKWGVVRLNAFFNNVLMLAILFLLSKNSLSLISGFSSAHFSWNSPGTLTSKHQEVWVISAPY